MAKRNIRILAVILVLAMTAALLPVTAAAAETTDTWNVSKSKTAKDENDAKNYLKEKIPGMNLHGTNLPAGLALAKSILDADTTVSSSHKYVITVTDGLTYLFNNANGETCGIFNNGYIDGL
jgi:ABC-type glycerol-3-phosphate transport system substrate-binding protein